jgi:hypothetical protein
MSLKILLIRELKELQKLFISEGFSYKEIHLKEDLEDRIEALAECLEGITDAIEEERSERSVKSGK